MLDGRLWDLYISSCISPIFKGLILGMSKTNAAGKNICVQTIKNVYIYQYLFIEHNVCQYCWGVFASVVFTIYTFFDSIKTCTNILFYRWVKVLTSM